MTRICLACNKDVKLKDINCVIKCPNCKVILLVNGRVSLEVVEVVNAS